MTSSNPIAIIQHAATVSITFAEKPSDETRRQLRDAKFRYENGKWYRTQPESYMASEELVAQVVAA